jgi:site-specific DNA recombinase
MAGKPTRAVVYCRISSDPEGEALGVERQEQDCRALAERLGWQLHPHRSVIIDNNIGASTRSRKRRPGFDELVEGVQAGTFDGVLYYSNSRLTRRPVEYEKLIELVETTGVRLASVVSGTADLSTADGRGVARTLAAWDAAEAERIGERVARAFRQRREEHGLPNPCRRAFGYAAGGLEVVEDEAQAIRDAAKMIISGASLGDVIRAWTEAGVRPVHGATGWTRQTVKGVLTKARVAGLVESRGAIIGEGSFPAILDRDTWEAVRTAIADRSSLARAAYKGREHLLAGLLTCGLCDRPVKVNALRHPDGSLRPDSYVICSRAQHGCGRTKRNLALLEEFVVGAVEVRLAELTRLYDPTAEAGTDTAGELTRLLAEQETLESKINKLRQRYETDDEFDVEDFVPMNRRLRTRLREVEAMIADYRQPTAADLGDDPLAAWQAGSPEDRREILAALIDTVLLRPIGKVGPVKARQMIGATTDIFWR